MKLLVFCLLAVGLASAELVKEYPHLLVKINLKSTNHVAHLQKFIRQSNAQAHFITPLSAGKSAYAVVEVKGYERFESLLKRRHIPFKVIDSTNIQRLSVDNSMHSPSVYPYAASPKEGYVIESPRVTNWGVWGNWTMCPTGQYATGMRLKTEHYQGNGDDTALNAVVLLCAVKGSHQYTEIHSLEGPWGTVGKTFYCPYSSLVRGFQLRSEESQGNGDDTAANNLRIVCDVSEDSTVEGDGEDWGSWTDAQVCLPGQGVCGFRTQVEPSQGGGDDTALNNVDMVCCDLAPGQRSAAQSDESEEESGEQGPSHKAIDPALLAELLALAEKYAAPFKQSALDRLHDGIFGSGRAARSTDVAIYNTLGKSFRFQHGDCEESGGWSSTLLPEHDIPEHKSVVHGAESHGVMTGATKCKVHYRATDGTYFEVITSNPYFGDNSVTSSSSPSIKVTTIKGVGNNNVVKAIIEPR